VHRRLLGALAWVTRTLQNQGLKGRFKAIDSRFLQMGGKRMHATVDVDFITLVIQTAETAARGAGELTALL